LAEKVFIPKALLVLLKDGGWYKSQSEVASGKKKAAKAHTSDAPRYLQLETLLLIFKIKKRRGLEPRPNHH
jgi:hypothetical protein